MSPRGKVLWQRTGVAGERSEIAVGDTAVYITQQQGGSDVLPPSDGSITALSRADGTQFGRRLAILTARRSSSMAWSTP